MEEYELSKIIQQDGRLFLIVDKTETEDYEVYDIETQKIQTLKLKDYSTIEIHKDALLLFIKEAYNKKIQQLIKNDEPADGYVNGLVMITQSQFFKGTQ
jgi:hypothetical protein